MAKNKKQNIDLLPLDQIGILEENYLEKIDTSAKYSIEVDPENHYSMSESQKEFIRHYVQYKNIPLAAKLANIDEDTAIDYFNKYSTKMEIRRINLAYYHRAFATKLLGIDEIGGYLTSLLIDENIAEADKLGKKDKLQVVKLLMEVNQLKQEAMSSPDRVIDVVDIQEDLNNLSVDTIKKMLETSEAKKNKVDQVKEDCIENMKENNPALTPEEIAHLKTLSRTELMEILEATNKGLENDKK